MNTKSVGKKQHFEVNDELIRKLDQGEIRFEDLDEETDAAVGAYLNKAAAEPAPEGEAQAGATEDKTPVQDDATKPPKGFVEGKRFKEKSDEASDYKNKWLAEQKRLRELEEKLKAKEREPVPEVNLSDAWSDQGQVSLHKTVAEMKRDFDDLKAARSKELEDARAEHAKAQNLTELHMLRANPLFKDAAPEGTLEDMEAAYSAFYYATGATEQDATPVKKFFEDANFRKDLEAKGVKPPKDFEKINVMLQVKALRDQFRKVDPDFKMSDAYVHFMSKNNKLPEVLLGERLKGAAEVADKLHNIANETITMQPGLTTGTSQDDWSDAQMEKWLDEHKHPKTKDEIATFNRICSVLDARAKAASY